jgi:hypothetical protein
MQQLAAASVKKQVAVSDSKRLPTTPDNFLSNCQTTAAILLHSKGPC